MMASMPKGLTASTGMDALTHAIEGYTTKGCMGDDRYVLNLKAIELISKYFKRRLRKYKGRSRGVWLWASTSPEWAFQCVDLVLSTLWRMLWALYMIHLTALQMPSFCRLLWSITPPCTGTKYRDIAIAMGVEGAENMSQEEYRKAAVEAVKKLSADVGIPADLKGNR